MKYLEKSFSFSYGGNQSFRDNWDRTFSKKQEEEADQSQPNPLDYVPENNEEAN